MKKLFILFLIIFESSFASDGCRDFQSFSAIQSQEDDGYDERLLLLEAIRMLSLDCGKKEESAKFVRQLNGKSDNEKTRLLRSHFQNLCDQGVNILHKSSDVIGDQYISRAADNTCCECVIL